MPESGEITELCISTKKAVSAVLDLDQALDAYVKTINGAGQGVTEAVQPVMQSGQRAVNYFFKGLPPSKAKSTN